MYRLNHIRKVAMSNILGGVIVAIVGTAEWILLLRDSAQIGESLIGALVSFLSFGAVWYFLRVMLATQLYLNLNKEQNWNKTEITRLNKMPAAEPTRNGLPFMNYHITRLVVIFIAVLILTYMLTDLVGLSLGSFVGGWLAGSGLGKWHFIAKMEKEQAISGRIYFFNDPDFGPYAKINYFNPAEVVVLAESQGLSQVKKPTRNNPKSRAAQPLVRSDSHYNKRKS
ncbi:hypothetical protein [Candidatus Chlorohelix sp.]|uniref:hypothetical protein n=1 Tax=Candidatus Chlorohelix sp. TaxID=3139201 RepID=UPI00303E402A